MADTPVAAKAEASANKAAEELDAKRAQDNKSAAIAAKANADADAKDRAKAEASANKAAASAPLAPPSPPDPRDTPAGREQRQRMAVMQDYRAAGEKIYEALRSPDVGLDEGPAAILAVHLLETSEDGPNMGRTEVIHWVRAFQQQHPVAWPAIRTGHMPQFKAAMQRCGIDTLPIDEIDTRAAAIRMPKSAT